MTNYLKEWDFEISYLAKVKGIFIKVKKTKNGFRFLNFDATKIQPLHEFFKKMLYKSKNL